jgi:predicted enzyme related to lactoylglutathione lyase
MSMDKVAHFEIPADDINRAKKFYEKAFGWKIEKWKGLMEYYMVTTHMFAAEDKSVPGINGGLVKKQKPLMQVTNTIAVKSLDQALKKILENGGTVVQPKTEIPGVGFMAYCKDTEGNLFGVMESTMGGSM